jgi:hypothetical protein
VKLVPAEFKVPVNDTVFAPSAKVPLMPVPLIVPETDGIDPLQVPTKAAVTLLLVAKIAV